MKIIVKYRDFMEWREKNPDFTMPCDDTCVAGRPEKDYVCCLQCKSLKVKNVAGYAFFFCREGDRKACGELNCYKLIRHIYVPYAHNGVYY